MTSFPVRTRKLFQESLIVCTFLFSSGPHLFGANQARLENRSSRAKQESKWPKRPLTAFKGRTDTIRNGKKVPNRFDEWGSQGHCILRPWTASDKTRADHFRELTGTNRNLMFQFKKSRFYAALNGLSNWAVVKREVRTTWSWFTTLHGSGEPVSTYPGWKAICFDFRHI